MTFGTAIKTGFRNLTNFKGRSRRSEFWWFYLFISLVSIPFSLILVAIGMGSMMSTLAEVPPGGELTDEQAGRVVGAMGLMYGLAFLLSLVVLFFILAVWVRRLHDAGYSGHWLWLSLAGLSIIPFIFAFFDSQPRTNQWGPDPKAAERPGSWVPQPGAAPAVAQAPVYPPSVGAPLAAPPAVPPVTSAPPAPPASADPFSTPQQ